jgi:hypothetical protein
MFNAASGSFFWRVFLPCAAVAAAANACGRLRLRWAGYAKTMTKKAACSLAVAFALAVPSVRWPGGGGFRGSKKVDWLIRIVHGQNRTLGKWRLACRMQLVALPFLPIAIGMT